MMASHIVKTRRYRTMQEAIDRIEELEIELGMPAQKPAPFGLTRREFEVASIIGKTGYASKNRLVTVVYGGLSEAGDNTIKMMVKKVRDKLAPHGIRISTVWGQGHSMGPESLYRWRVALGGGEG